MEQSSGNWNSSWVACLDCRRLALAHADSGGFVLMRCLFAVVFQNKTHRKQQTKQGQEKTKAQTCGKQQLQHAPHHAKRLTYDGMRSPRLFNKASENALQFLHAFTHGMRYTTRYKHKQQATNENKAQAKKQRTNKQANTKTKTQHNTHTCVINGSPCPKTGVVICSTHSRTRKPTTICDQLTTTPCSIVVCVFAGCAQQHITQIKRTQTKTEQNNRPKHSIGHCTWWHFKHASLRSRIIRSKCKFCLCLFVCFACCVLRCLFVFVLFVFVCFV